MSNPSCDLIRVFDRDPDLLAGVEEPATTHLRTRMTARRVCVERGPWLPTVTGTDAGQATVTPTVAADKKTTRRRRPSTYAPSMAAGPRQTADSMWSPPASGRPQTLRTTH